VSKELVDYLARSLVGRPEKVAVTERQGEHETLIELRVAPEDFNGLIGRQGGAVRAMRLLLAAASAKSGRRYGLELLQAPPESET
jgi:predicted RNA-binding protein YlqC (UPF0109 family)